MRGFFGLIAFAAAITMLLYMAQPDAPLAVVELATDPLAGASASRCEVTNIETLRKSAIVYTWVNGTERCYNKRRQRAGLSPGGSSRDKEMDELKYSIRSLLKFAPWLEGPIYIVTPGQIPVWLDVNNPRVRVIDQDDLLPEKATRPTFDTNVIEQYLHKIPGLTDTFIHMNDDYLFIKPVTPDRFFTCDGGLRFLTEINHIRHVKGTQSNAWLASVRNTLELTDKTYGGEHVYNFLKHAPFVYSRRGFEAIHEKFQAELDATLTHQLRHHDDLNMPLLHHVYMNEEGSRVLGIPVQFNPISECDDWLLVRVTDNKPEELDKQFAMALANKGPEVLLALNDEYSRPATAERVGRFYRALLPEAQYYELPAGQTANPVSNYHGEECAYDASVLPLPAGSTQTTTSLRQRFMVPAPVTAPPSPHARHFKHLAEASASFGSNVMFTIGLALGVLSAIIIFRIASQDVLGADRTKSR